MADTLYSRLGGYDGIAMFATTLVGQAHKDELLGRFWSDRGEDRIARELQLLIDYLVKETGGQMYYTGRDMALAHQSLNGNVSGEGGGQCKPDSAIFAAKTGVADKSHGAPHSQTSAEINNAI